MHLFGAFELDIRPGTPDHPAGVKVALLRYTRGEDGRLFITPECTSFAEIKAQINSLQDELDEILERARRAFQATGCQWLPTQSRTVKAKLRDSQTTPIGWVRSSIRMRYKFHQSATKHQQDLPASGGNRMTSVHQPDPARQGEDDCAYNLFRNKCLPEIVCAVPEDRPVPHFIDPEHWAFEQPLRSPEARPPGFDSSAARTGVRFNGFYLFYAFAAIPAVRTALEMMGGL
jgi:hypothetical protein